MSVDEVFIVSAVRSPVGSLNGSLSTLKASELGTHCIQEALKRARLNGDDVSEVILGQILTAGQGQNPARQASIHAGIPNKVPAILVNQLCASGLRSVALAYQAIKCGDSNVVVAGGMESMSRSQHSVHTRSGVKFGDISLKDTMLVDGLTDSIHHVHMGITAENVSKQFGVKREDQDHFAYESQRKCKEAQNSGAFDNEILPIPIKTRTGMELVSKDEFPRNDTTLEKLAKLKPAFLMDGSGSVTAGNSSGVNDGAAILVLASGLAVKQKNLTPLARVKAWHQVGVDPLIMGMGPVEAIRGAAIKAGWTLDDVDLFEINEAFASQSVAVVRELQIDPQKVNVRGGAIALGHPIGASGARILVTLLHALKSLGLKRGIAGLCVGGGMGVAVAVEVVG